MKILGYADRVSAAPGDTIRVMVSCERDRYHASLVRVIQGDVGPLGPGYREEPVALEIGGPFPGRIQPIHTGSYCRVENDAAFEKLDSFTLVAAVWPTTPSRGVQTIMARRDPHTGAGFELGLDEAGALTFTYCARGDFKCVSTASPLLARHWYDVSASFDFGTGRMTVSQRPCHAYPGIEDAASVSAVMDSAAPPPPGVPLTLAARVAVDRPAERHFNGRIDSPRLYACALAEAELAAALDVDAASAIGDPRLVAAWDFSLDIPTDKVTDIAGNGLHGRLINLPARGVTGRHWCGAEYDWKRCPSHYGAVHFHDDDLYDAAWEEDFSFAVPLDLPSGVYAVRLSTEEDEYFVVFCVRPPRDRATAKIVFLMPSASYLAYANNRIGLDVPETELVCGRLIQLTEQDLFMQEHPELGLSFYDLHNDGSPVYYSSRLRPVVDMQPKFVGKLGGVGSNVWQFNADTHILGWLESQGHAFDVITDEDLHHEGYPLIRHYTTVITGTHPEYSSSAMLDALERYTDSGGRLMYLGGNGFYWRISLHPELPGVIECRKSEDGIRAASPLPGEYYASFTGEYTGLWRRNGRPPNRLVGVGMAAQGFDVSSPYRRTEASRDLRVAFIFAGVEEELLGDFGLAGGGAAGIEVDAADPDLGSPPHALVLASSQAHTDVYLVVPEDMLDPVPGLGGVEASSIRADMVFFETSGGGAVFSAGSIAWAGAMAWNGYDNHIARITGNVLKRFLDAAPFRHPADR